MIKAGILGSTGYAGSELVRLLLGHPEVEIAFVDSHSHKDKPYTALYPHLRGYFDQKATSIDLDDLSNFDGIDVLFCALPHGLTQKAVRCGLQADVKIVDLSADFRLHDAATYEKWYNTPHTAQEALKEAVYGLTEVHRANIPAARLIANPGCYPTSILLPLYPLLVERAVGTTHIIANSLSGVSGAGRGLSDGNLYSQASDNARAYGVATHRHLPEIEQELSLFADEPVAITFTPHLVPMVRGMLSTIYLDNVNQLTAADAMDIIRDYYRNEPFIRLLPEGQLPQTKNVTGTNLLEMSVAVDAHTGKIIVVSAIDNLLKGASGQAVQNMNLLFGFKETTGLEYMPLWP